MLKSSLMAKIIVTGGAGFIGSHIQDTLIEKGHTVAVLDNLFSGKKDRLNTKSIFFDVDLTNLEGTKKVIKDFQPEYVFHTAAQVEVPYSMTHPVEDAQINILGLINLLEALKSKPSKKFIYSNTGGAYYGEVDEKDLPIDEDHLVNKPTSFYGTSKLCAEQYLKLFGNTADINWISLRYSNVYGPRQDGNKEAGVVAIFTEKMLKNETPTIFGDGNATRDYIYVEDVVMANLKAMDYPKQDYFNIATEIQTSTQEIFDTIEHHLNTGIKPNYAPPRPGDPLRNSLSIQKAKKLLNWQPKFSFQEGIKKTLEYYNEIGHKNLS